MTRHRRIFKHQLNGFTLIELMIAVVIVSILAMVALPSYQESVRKTRRAEAKELALRLAQAQERHFTQYLKYATALTGTQSETNLGWAAANLNSSNGYYSVDTANSSFTATAYTVAIQPVGGSAQAADKCGSFRLTHLGKKTYTGTGGTVSDCW